MFNFHKIIISGFFYLMLIFHLPGCGAETNNKFPFIQDTTSEGWIRQAPLPRVASKEQAEKVVAHIKDYIQNYKQQNAQVSWDQEEIEFSPATPSENSVKQRILILEGFFVPNSAMLRYRKRVLGFHKIDKSADYPQYKEYFPKTKVYSALKDISYYLSDLPFHMPAELLNETGLAGGELCKILHSQPFMAHGVPIFEWLADFLPEAQFVIADIPIGNQDKESFCNFAQDNNLDIMEKKIQYLTEQLKEIIKNYQINYITISEAPSREGLKVNYETICQRNFNLVDKNKVNQLLAIKTNFFRELSTLKDVAVFQGLPNDHSYVSDPDDKSNDLVCAKYDNLVRVGYLGRGDFNFDESGGFDSKLLDSGQLNLVKCANLYINSGVSEPKNIYSDLPDEREPTTIGTNPLYYRCLGLGAIKIVPVMATSWATPLALAHYIYLKNMGGPQTVDEFHYFMLTGRGFPKMIDPLKFYQFELYVR